MFLAGCCLHLSREHYGIVALAANRTKESSTHPSGLVSSVEDVHNDEKETFLARRQEDVAKKLHAFLL